MNARHHRIALGAALVLSAAPAWPAPVGFQEALVTEAVNQVDVLSGQSARPAKAQDHIRGNDVVRTGRQSRAEIQFPDTTIARVGANSVFSFRPDTRGFDLKQGSILFHSPKGLGGGQIRTAAATASVLGTTIVVTATLNGGFKFLVLEGKGKVLFPNGRSLIVEAGQMTFILSTTLNRLPPVLTFRLSNQTDSSNLLKGYKSALASNERIQKAIARQERLIERGVLDATDLLIGQVREDDKVELVGGSEIPPGEQVPRWEDLLAGNKDLFLDLLSRYRRMMRRPGFVQEGPFDPRHFIDDRELDNPIALIAFLTVLLDEWPGALRAIASVDEGSKFKFSSFCSAFVARGIDFNTATVHLNQARGCDVFTFLSLADIVFHNSVEFAGYAGRVKLIARGAIHIPDNASFSSQFPGMDLALRAGQSMTFNGVNFDLPFGELVIRTPGAVDITGGFWNTPKGLDIFGGQSVTIQGLSFGSGSFTSIGNFSLAYGPPPDTLTDLPPPSSFSLTPVKIISGGPISLQNTSFDNAFLRIITPDTLTIGGTFSATSLDATAGTFDIDWTYFPTSFDSLRLFQLDPWSLSLRNFSASDDLILGSLDDLGLTQVSLAAGEEVVLFGDDVLIDGGSSISTSVTLGGEGIKVDAEGKLQILNSTINSANHIDVFGGDITLDGATLDVSSLDPLHVLRVEAVNNLIANNTTFRSTGGAVELKAAALLDLTGGTIQVPGLHEARLTAGDMLTVNGTLFQAQRIRMQAATIALQNINFPSGSEIWLNSTLGVLAPFPNSNRPIELGKVNYINSVMYGSSLLTGDHPSIHINPIP